MLNNLAASFQSSMVRRNEEIDVQSRKRQKTDVYPAYLLNLCCPRSSYDLHFEPSKTTVEFKDWQSILFFVEQTITNYWKKRVPQLSKVKSNQGLLKHHNVQNKEDVAGLYQSSLQKNAVRDSKVDISATTTPKDLHCFSLDVGPSTRHIYYPHRISDESQHADIVARNDRKLGHKQMCSPESDSYQWLENVPSQSEDCDLLGANPAVWKKRRSEGIFHGHEYSGNFGMLEDVQTKGLLADNQDSEIIGPEIGLEEPCFGVLNRPNRITSDFVQNQTNIKSNTLGCDGSYGEFDKLNEDCLLNEVTEAVTDPSCTGMSHFSGGFCHEDCSTSRGFCGVMKTCSTRKKLGTAVGYVEGLEANTIAQMNFPDILAVWESDDMDRSSIKDTFLHFPHPFSLAGTSCNRSPARTDLDLHGRSNNSFDYWNCENIDSDFRFTLHRFNSDSSIICEGTKRFNDFDNETQLPNYFNQDDFSVDQFVSKDGQIPRKSKIDTRLPYNISPEKSATGCHLDVSSPQMAEDNMLIEDLRNQHNFGCSRRSSLSKGKSRSCSAPPFYRGKRKFPRLNEPLTRLTAEGDKDIFIKDSEDTAPALEDISQMNATQPIPETSSSEFSDPNFSLKANAKMCEETCSDGLEDSTAQITKWRDDSYQHTVEHVLKF